MSVSVCSVCVICVWLMPRSKVWHAKVLTICCQLANFLVITDSTLNYMYVNVSKRTSVCVCVCVRMCVQIQIQITIRQIRQTFSVRRRFNTLAGSYIL